MPSPQEILENPEYADPQANYQRLLDTCNYLYADSTPHPMFFTKHTQHLIVYREVVAQSRVMDRDLIQKMNQLIAQYEEICYFDLSVYLEVCEKLVNIIHNMSKGEVDDDFISAFGAMGVGVN